MVSSMLSNIIPELPHRHQYWLRVSVKSGTREDWDGSCVNTWAFHLLRQLPQTQICYENNQS